GACVVVVDAGPAGGWRQRGVILAVVAIKAMKDAPRLRPARFFWYFRVNKRHQGQGACIERCSVWPIALTDQVPFLFRKDNAGIRNPMARSVICANSMQC
ncbi:hypothetical protein, partial [Chromohalobacter sp. HP20-39]|uniref:hypothetical protein n=1 Tax=Chromohalobacter sp. HP20-39 TaxID=3079306 RepID=UPI00294AE159